MSPSVAPQPRALFLINHYMGGIHAGIQAGHAISRFHMAHPPGHSATPLIELWNQEPWFELRNGGFDAHLEEAALALEAINRDIAITGHPSLPPGSGIPFVRFHEGQRELRGTLTAVVMLLPGDFFLRNEEGDLPEGLAAVLKKARRSRAETATLRTDLTVSERVALLFEGLPFAH